MTANTINDAVTMHPGAAGTLLAGRYRVVRQLGQGGMGSVWLAEDTQLDGKLFAIKMLPTILVSNKRAYRQLKDEALVAMQLVHPNIVQIRAFEENNGNPFLVMDYIEGKSLDDCLEEWGTLSESEAIALLKPVAKALDYAHSQGVVHRDVKPGNVMVRMDGTPFILDFGIAREIQETMTRVTGKLSSGTLLYMSPEQLNGEPPKPAQDVYSFAAMVYECLKGEPPFSRGQIEHQILNNRPEPLPLDGSPISRSVMAGLAKRPENRPTTCVSVLKGFCRNAQLQEIRRERIPVAMEAPRLAGGKRLWLGVGSVALVAIVVGVVLWHGCDRSQMSRSVQQVSVTNSVPDIEAGDKKKDPYALFEKGEYQEVISEMSSDVSTDPDVAYVCGLIYAKGLLGKNGQMALPDLKKAESCFAEAIKFDHPLSCCELGMLYCQGAHRIEKDGRKGLSLIQESKDRVEKMAKSGNRYAQELMGDLHWNGYGCPTNRGVAVEWYLKMKDRCLASASDGVLHEQFTVGLLWEDGLWGWTNGIAALKWYGAAADRGYVLAQVHLGVMYWEGTGVTQDYYKAVKWLRKAAEQGYADAQNLMGRAYNEGWGVAKDLDEALKWYRKAADQDNIAAQFNLGFMYWNGEGVAQDYYDAVKWLRKAAEQGNADAQNLMGWAYYEGWGVAKDFGEALKWFRKAADQDNVVAQYNIGFMYWNGSGVTQDYYEAVEWLRKSAEQDYADAQNLMGRAYNEGWGVAKDLGEALKWYRKAADQDNISAQYNLGAMYWDGVGVEQDYAVGVKWLRKAADQGDADAQNLMGRAYYEGWSVTKDFAEALKWYRKAADQDNMAAQFNLGVCYEDGQGVGKNMKTAISLYQKAAEKGFQDAIDALSRLGVR